MKSLDSVISRSYWKQFLHEYIMVRSYWTLLWSKTGSTRGISSSSLFGLMSNDTRKQSNVPNCTCIRKIGGFFNNVFVFWTLLNLTDMVIGSYRINGFCRSTSSWASIFLLNPQAQSGVEATRFSYCFDTHISNLWMSFFTCFCLFWISQFGSGHVSILDLFNRDDNNNGACDSSRAVAVVCSLIPCAWSASVIVNSRLSACSIPTN